MQFGLLATPPITANMSVEKEIDAMLALNVDTLSPLVVD